MVVSMSAFAESRHRDDTDSSRGKREESQQHGRIESRIDQNRSELRNESRNNEQRNNETRNDNRSYRNDNNRNDNRNDSGYRNNDRGSRNDSSYRNNDRSYRDNGSYRNNNNNNNGRYDNRNYDNGNRYSTRGRVSRIEPWRGGYRVYIGGGYPFFVTDAWYRAHRLRIGIEIGLGGIWNSGGYYDVYDDPYGYGYNAAGDLRGVVETVDYRRGTAVVRDDLSGSFVTIVLRGADRRLASMRPGDYVTLGGEWSRAGVFNAYNLLDLQYGRY